MSIIHGNEDETIPVTASEKILEAAPDRLVNLVIIPDAGHVAGHLDDEKNIHKYNRVFAKR